MDSKKNRGIETIRALLKSDKSMNFRILGWFIIGFGILCRLRYYLADLSLGLDEATCVLNLARSYLELLFPVRPFPSEPVGYLLIQKFLMHTFGSSEYSLRLIPILSGIIALFLFYRLARSMLRPVAALIALGLFAISEPVIFYSAKLKPYESDIAITLFLLLLGNSFLLKKRPSWRDGLFLGIAGGLSMWFSHPAVFVLAGIGSCLIYRHIKGSTERDNTVSAIALGAWLISFAGLYLVALRRLASYEILAAFWDGSFAPSPISVYAFSKWTVKTFFNSFVVPAGLPLNGIAAFVFLIGSIALFLRKRETLFLLISPILFGMAAAVARLYPFTGRLIFFIVPSLLFLAAEGIVEIRDAARSRLLLGRDAARPRSIPIGGILIAFLCLHPFLSATRNLISPRAFEHIKPVLSHVRDNRQADDVIYVYYGAYDQWRYYAKRYHFSERDYREGVRARNDLAAYKDDLERLRGKRRVWVVFSHVYRGSGIDEEQFFLSCLDICGTRLDEFRGAGSSAYLYDLSARRQKDRF